MIRRAISTLLVLTGAIAIVQWAGWPATTSLFRGKFRALMHKAGLLDRIPSSWQQDWNVNCQAVPSAEASIAYLAPYVFKVAISDYRHPQSRGRTGLLLLKKEPAALVYGL